MDPFTPKMIWRGYAILLTLQPSPLPLSQGERGSEIGSAILELTQELAKPGILAKGIEIAILAKIAEIVVAELDRLAQRAQGKVDFLEKRIAAGKVVMGE